MTWPSILKTFPGANTKRIGSGEVTLVPNAAVSVAFAYWEDDGNRIIRPYAEHGIDYYDEMTQGTRAWIFHVVAFDDSGHFVTKEIRTTIDRVDANL